MDLDSPWIDELFRIERPEAVLHQAAQASVRRSVEDPVFDAGVKRAGNRGVAAGQRASRRAPLPLRLHRWRAVRRCRRDAHAGGLSHPAGFALRRRQVSAEVYLRTFNALHGLSYAALRYANVYGPATEPTR